MDKQKAIVLLKEGKTFREVSEELGVSLGSVQNIRKRYLPRLGREEFGLGLKKKLEKEKFFNQFGDIDEDLKEAYYRVFTAKKHNVRQGKGKRDFVWDIEPRDIEWNTHCPILGIALDYYAEGRQENSPSFDRVDPDKDYVKGNVKVISWRANRIKNDGTLEDHIKIVRYLTENKS